MPQLREKFWQRAAAGRLLCAILALLVLAEALGQNIDLKVPTHSIDGSFVREWLVLGPFPSKDLEHDFLTSAGGEAKARPSEGQVVVQEDSSKRTWTRTRSDYDLVNFERVLGPKPWSVAYIYCELDAPEEMEIDLRLCAVSAVFWLNGMRMEAAPSEPAIARMAPPVFPVRLKRGRNACLVKLAAQGDAKWLLSLQPFPPARGKIEVAIKDSKNQPVTNATVQLYKGGSEVCRVNAGSSGTAQVCLYPLEKSYDARVTSDTTGTWLYDIALRPGESRKLSSTLPEAISISGRVLAMDGSPQHAIVVQAIRVEGRDSQELAVGSTSNHLAQPLLPSPAFSESVASGTNGVFEFVNLRPGAYRLRCHGPSGFVAPTNALARESVIVEAGRTNERIDFVMPEAHKGTWRNYVINKGLVELNPWSIYRRRNGTLWVGTQNSTLHSYDGIDFKVMESPRISGNAVERICSDAEGALWVAASEGVSREVNGRLEVLPAASKLPLNHVWSVFPDPDGSVWLGTSSGLCRYDRTKFSQWTVAEGLPCNEITSVIRTRDGVLWLGSEFGLVRFENGKFSRAIGPTGGIVRALRQTRDGAIWFGKESELEGGAYRFDGRTLRRLGIEDGLLSDRIFAIAQTSDGDVWLATGKGLSRFNGSTIVNYTLEDGLSNEWVRDIFVDEDDVLWLANGWGVSRFDPKGFYHTTRQDGLLNGTGKTASVFAIQPSGDTNFLVGTEWGGLYRMNPAANPPAISLVRSQPEYVRRIARSPDGSLWLGTSKGLFQQENGKLDWRLDRKWVSALASDNRGGIWFGQGWVGGGLSRFDPLTKTEKVMTSREGLPDDFVWALSADGESMWVGTGAGVARLEGEKLVDQTTALGIPRAGVYDLRRDSAGKLWIATARGLYCWDGARTISLTASNGLPTEHAWCTAQTRDDILWIGTDSNGLIGYDGKAMTGLDARDGLQGNRVFTLAPDAHGSIWAGFLDGGLTRYTRGKTRPSIHLEEVSVDGRDWTNAAAPARAETGQRVRIRYREIDLKTHLDKRQFWRRVLNQSGTTILAAVTKERSFDWVPDRAGTYAFEVQAIDRDLNYSEPVRVMMQITVPWHANAWILIPLVSMFAGLVISLGVIRALYSRKSREAFLMRERVRIARDLHDHLGARLTHLAMVGDLVRERLGSSPEHQLLAANLSETARELTRTMGEVIWATDPEKDTLRSFALFVTRYAERFFAQSPLRLRFEVPSELPDIPLPAEVRNSLFMVTKEALNNVAKHAGASELRIKMEFANGELRLCFEDNGRGFSRPPDGREGHGLENMQERLRDLGGEFRIESGPGEGTTIHVSLHLPKR